MIMSRSAITEIVKMKVQLVPDCKPMMPDAERLPETDDGTPFSLTNPFGHRHYGSVSSAFRFNDSGYFTPSPNLANITSGMSSADSCPGSSGMTGVTTPSLSYLGMTPSLPVVRRRLNSSLVDEAKSVVSETFSRPITRSIAARDADRLRVVANRSGQHGRVLVHVDEVQTRRVERRPAVGAMQGAKYVDFVVRLQERSLREGISRILNGLEPHDLGAVCCVNRKWRAACHADRKNDKRRIEFIKSIRIEKENAVVVSRVRVPTYRSPFKAVRESTNQLPIRIPDPPQFTSDRSTENFRLLLEVRKTLGQDDVLDKCPRCSSPARVFRQPRHAVCCRKTCSFDYCTECRCDYVNHRPCEPYVPRMPPTTTKANSARRNLRRLLT